MGKPPVTNDFFAHIDAADCSSSCARRLASRGGAAAFLIVPLRLDLWLRPRVLKTDEAPSFW